MVLREYLKRHGAVVKDSDNVAEFMLEAIGAGSSPRIGRRDWAHIWDESAEFADMKETISQLKTSRLGVGRTENHGLEKEYASPFSHQLKLVCKRMNVAYWRTPNYLFTRLFNHVATALITVSTLTLSSEHVNPNLIRVWLFCNWIPPGPLSSTRSL